MEKKGKNTRQKYPPSPTPATHRKRAAAKAGFSTFFPTNPTLRELFYKKGGYKNSYSKSRTSRLAPRQYTRNCGESACSDDTCRGIRSPPRNTTYIFAKKRVFITQKIRFIPTGTKDTKRRDLRKFIKISENPLDPCYPRSIILADGTNVER